MLNKPLGESFTPGRLERSQGSISSKHSSTKPKLNSTSWIPLDCCPCQRLTNSRSMEHLESCSRLPHNCTKEPPRDHSQHSDVRKLCSKVHTMCPGTDRTGSAESCHGGWVSSRCCSFPRKQIQMNKKRTTTSWLITECNGAYTKTLCRSISRNMIAHMDTCVGFRWSAEHLGFGDKARHTPPNPSTLIQNLSSHWQCIEALQHQQLAKPSHRHEESSAHRRVRLHGFLVKIRDPNGPNQTNKQKPTGFGEYTVLYMPKVLCLVLLRALDQSKDRQYLIEHSKTCDIVFSESKTALSAV